MRLAFTFLFLLLPWSLVEAQDEKPVEKPAPALTTEEKKREALNGILTRRETLRETIREKRKITQDEGLTDFERSEAAKEIAELQLRIQNLEKEFSNLATGIDLEDLDATPEDINLDQELKEILRPLIEEFREITAAPREIEDLRSDIQLHKNRLKMITEAEQALQKNIDPANPATLNKALKEKLADLQVQRQNLETELGIAEAKLAERQANTPTFFTSLSEMVQEFFRTRGAHLLVGIVAAIAMVFVIRLAYRGVLKLGPAAINKSENFTGRLLHLGYLLVSVTGALLAFVITLYLANDWLLLAITLLFFLGIAWAGKNTLPQYVEQAKMILNLGTVRYKERLIYQGIPWQVQKINFYTTLKNPALEGGLIRLPMRDLMPLHSRPNGAREHWFPTQEDDWVILSDGTLGKVIQQTPDYVHLVKLGGSRKIIPTADFLSLHPENISRNFRISITFGIDYRHQKIATDQVPAILRASVQRALIEKVDKDQLFSLQVFFTSASASSLDYRIVADFSGELAPRINTLRDFIQATCVETCNQQDWNIPFTQITVHQAREEEKQDQEESPPSPNLP